MSAGDILTTNVTRDVFQLDAWAVELSAGPIWLTLTLTDTELEALHRAVTEIDEHTTSTVRVGGDDDMRPDPVEVQVDGSSVQAKLTVRTDGGSTSSTVTLAARPLRVFGEQLARSVARSQALHEDDDEGESE